jgi:hypothetical protein
MKIEDSRLQREIHDRLNAGEKEPSTGLARTISAVHRIVDATRADQQEDEAGGLADTLKVREQGHGLDVEDGAAVGLRRRRARAHSLRRPPAWTAWSRGLWLAAMGFGFCLALHWSRHRCGRTSVGLTQRALLPRSSWA